MGKKKINLPESFFEEDGKEDDTDASAHLDDNFDKIPATLKVLTDHQRRRLSHQGDGDAHQSSVTVAPYRSVTAMTRARANKKKQEKKKL